LIRNYDRIFSGRLSKNPPVIRRKISAAGCCKLKI
jgi:hypothetical protein